MEETPSYGGGANLSTQRKEFWGLNRPWRGREERPEPTLSGEFPLEGGRDEVSAGPRPPRWRERKGRPEMSLASPEMVGRMEGGGERVGGGGREKRKAGRNLRSPSPATEREKGWGTGPRLGIAISGVADLHNDPSPPSART